jgi:hypothetical protein
LGNIENISRHRRFLLAIAVTAAVALGAPPAHARGGRGEQDPAGVTRGGNDEVSWTSQSFNQKTAPVGVTTIPANGPYPMPAVERRVDGSFRVYFPESGLPDYLLTIPPQLITVPRSTRANPKPAEVDFTGSLGIVVGSWIRGPTGVLLPSSFTIIDEDYRYANLKELREIPRLHFQMNLTAKKRGFSGLFVGGNAKSCSATITFMDGQRLADDEHVRHHPEHEVGPTESCGPWIIPSFQAEAPPKSLQEPMASQPILPDYERDAGMAD